MLQPQNISELQNFVSQKFCCGSTYSQTEYVEDPSGGRFGWDGYIRLFRLLGPFEGECCYAWDYKDGQELKHMVILQTRAIHTAEEAVQAGMADSLDSDERSDEPRG